MLISVGAGSSSWWEVRAACAGVVRELRDRGVDGSHRVVLSAANSPACVLITFALMELGVSLALVAADVTPARLAGLVEEAGADFFVCGHERDEPAFSELVATRIPVRALDDAADRPAGEVSALSFTRWARRTDALIVWTSGSHRGHRGVVHSGSSVLANVQRTQDRMRYTEHDVLLPLLPLTQQDGLFLLLAWWQAKSSLVLLPGRHAALALAAVVDQGVTVVDSVPSVYESVLRLVDSGWAGTALLESVRMWCVGGAPLPEDLRRRFTERIGKPLLDGYGSPEAGNIALASADNPHYCGRPLDGITVTVVDEQGRPLPPGEIGEVVVHSPDLMVGLLRPGGTMSEQPRPVHRTHDLGRLDEHGNLRVLGRKTTATVRPAP
ncbi:class I adenylate-forming enzyme family protein [Actinoplanes sp. N902-109]|uniref:class I adenylate-forming enzyme family protein n=1 Tax=Actinoplanes sp. (strain N902-109) TaxID=649831 RepID=UPI0003294BCB|nr:AMP-binding protein [Actinoplanes sp. N902-109]AGL12162.1 acyl-CoA synthetase [Actinoplanes sp. N902-109]AGL16490.1 AMP-binding domain-containing protein [Actinoplanes sp. N902-109]